MQQPRKRRTYKERLAFIEEQRQRERAIKKACDLLREKSAHDLYFSVFISSYEPIGIIKRKDRKTGAVNEVFRGNFEACFCYLETLKELLKAED